jgi:Dullard-like phosphatase family protein
MHSSASSSASALLASWSGGLARRFSTTLPRRLVVAATRSAETRGLSVAQQLQHARHHSSIAASASSPYSRSSSYGGGKTAPAQQQNHRRRHRHQVNGKAIPLHISDLYSQAALAVDDEEYDDYYYEEQNSPTTTTTAKQYESDLVVVLDMDECLIHSQFLSSPQTAQVYAHQLQQQRRQSGANGGAGVVDHFKITLPDGDLVHVNLRPGLREFLQDCTARFETHIFTAASAIYAKPVLDHLDPDGTRLAGRWYREHCQYMEHPQRAYIKKLDNLPFLQANPDRLARTVLVDNNPLSFLTHPENGILVSSFYTDPHDTSLRTVWKLLQKLDTEHRDDVRPLLTEKFGLQQALDKMKAQKEAERRRAVW